MAIGRVKIADSIVKFRSLSLELRLVVDESCALV